MFAVVALRKDFEALMMAEHQAQRSEVVEWLAECETFLLKLMMELAAVEVAKLLVMLVKREISFEAFLDLP